MSNFWVTTLLKKAFSAVETVISMVILMIFSLVLVGVNQMQREHSQLENMPESEVSQKVLVTNLNN